MSKQTRGLWSQETQPDPLSNSPLSEEDSNPEVILEPQNRMSLNVARVISIEEKRADVQPSPRSANKKPTNRSNWDKSRQIFVPDREEYTPGPRTGEVRKALSDLQEEYRKQGELFNSTKAKLRCKEKIAKKLELDNQELTKEVKELRTKLIEMDSIPDQIISLKEELADKDTEINELTRKQEIQKNLREELAHKDKEMTELKESARLKDLETQEKIEYMREELANKDKEMMELREFARKKDLEIEQKLASMRDVLANKEIQLTETKELARSAEQEIQDKVEEEVQRLTGLLARSAERLNSLQQHMANRLERTKPCNCRNFRIQETEQGFDELIPALQSDICLVKFEMEGLNSVLNDLKSGTGIHLSTLINRTLILKPDPNSTLEQCLEDLRGVKTLLSAIKITLVDIYETKECSLCAQQ